MRTARRVFLGLAIVSALGCVAAFAAARLAEDPWTKAQRLKPAIWQGRPGDGPVRLAVLPDIQNGLATFGLMLEDIARLEPPAEALVFTGDMAGHARPAHYATFVAALQGLNQQGLPCLFVAGNHDVLPGDEEPPRDDLYKAVFGDLDWTVDAGPCRLYGLGYRAPNTLTKEGWYQLVKGLVRDPAPPFGALFIHVPLAPYKDPLLLAVNDIQPRLSLIVAGHDHRYRDEDIAGIRQVVNGEGPDDSAKDEPGKPARYLVLDLAKDGVKLGERSVPRAKGSAAWWCWELRRSWSNYGLPWLRSSKGWALAGVACACLFVVFRHSRASGNPGDKNGSPLSRG